LFPIISRYVFSRVFGLFLLVAGLLCLLLFFRFIFGLIPLFEALSLKLSHLFILVAWNFPSLLNSILPISFALAIFFGLRDVSMLSETLAIQTFGLSLKILMRPLLVFAAFLVVLSFSLGFFINPSFSFQSLKFKNFLQTSFSKLVLNPKSINLIGKNFIYFDAPTDGGYSKLYIFPEAKNDNPYAITADFGKIRLDGVNKSLVLSLQNGSVLGFQKNAQEFNEFRFEKAEVNFQKQAKQEDQSDFTKEELDGFESHDLSFLLKKPNFLLDGLDLWKIATLAENPADRLGGQIQIWDRLLYSLSFLPFIFFAFSMGVQNPRLPQKGSIFYLLVFIFIYYQLTNYFKKAASFSVVPAFFMPLPFFVALFLGYFLYRGTLKNRPFF